MSAVACVPAELGRRFSPYANAPRLPAGESLVAEQILGFGAVTACASAAAERGPLELEIGPGRGGFILERLAHAADVRIIGLEIRLKWASLLDERVRELGHAERARVFAEDIRYALPRLATGSLSKVFINFPDPWWKKRHAKRRLANGGVIEQLARLLRPQGELFIQSDVWGTASAYRDEIEEHPAFLPLGDVAGSAMLAENPYAARSPRERRVMADGVPVIRLRYQRRELGEPT
jgi:tRNA (guanine-N7-)-methyltransferase